jgi:hypothetical protein
VYFAGKIGAVGPGFEPGLTDPELVSVGFAVVRGCLEIACLSRILKIMRSSLFADVCPGNCQISVKWVLGISRSRTLADTDREPVSVEPLQNQ